jgi:osmoprotectant transport system ATP-binding protein
MIQFDKVSKTFDKGKTYALKNFSLEIKTGETLILLGASGCGKTTALKLINRLIEASSGTIRIHQKDTQSIDPIELRRSIGYVCQGVGLFPHMTVAENITVTAKLSKKNFIDPTAIDALLMNFDLDPRIYLNRYPKELSGGQQQRVGFARAMAANPDIILMDEPFSALDAMTRYDVQGEVIRLQKTNPKTIIFVTHDLFEAFRLGDRIAIIHQGKLEQVGGRKEIIESPASAFVEELFASQAKTFHKLFKEVF